MSALIVVRQRPAADITVKKLQLYFEANHLTQSIKTTFSNKLDIILSLPLFQMKSLADDNFCDNITSHFIKPYSYRSRLLYEWNKANIIIISSSNTIEILKKYHQKIALPIRNAYIIGEQTAKIAANSGFLKPIIIAENAEKMLQLLNKLHKIYQHFDENNQTDYHSTDLQYNNIPTYLYLCGIPSTIDFSIKIQELGLGYGKKLPLYIMEEIDNQITTNILYALCIKHTMLYMMIYSSKNAEKICEILHNIISLHQENIQYSHQKNNKFVIKIYFICISEKVSLIIDQKMKKIQQITQKTAIYYIFHIICSKKPNEKSMRIAAQKLYIRSLI